VKGNPFAVVVPGRREAASPESIIASMNDEWMEQR